MTGRYDRINCLVPHCGRGTTRYPAGEYICADHWRLTDRRARRWLFRARRLGLWRIADYLWGRLRRQAIERAAGVSS